MPDAPADEAGDFYLRRRFAESPLLAQSGHSKRTDECSLLGVKRTWLGHYGMSAFEKAGIRDHDFLSRNVLGSPTVPIENEVAPFDHQWSLLN
jgi:hypothetical protein